MYTLNHYDRIAEYLRREELWLLLVEKIVVDSDRKQLIKSPSFLHSGISLYSDQFVILKIDILYQIVSESKIDIQIMDGEDHLLSRRLQRALWEVVPDIFVAYPFIHAGEAFMLLNFKNPVSKSDACSLEHSIGTLHKACQDFVNTAFSSFNLKVRIYIGPFISSMDKMVFKFDTLNNMAKLDFAFTENLDVILPPDSSQMQPANSAERVVRVKALTLKMMNAAQEHRFGESLAAANALIDLEASSYDTALSLSIRMGSRIEFMFDVLGIPPVVSTHSSIKAYAYKEALQESSSVLDLKEAVSKIYSDFEEYFAPISTAPVKNRIDEICSYITENYTNSNLCSDMICQKFGISGAYLSRLFKEQMGTKLIDYIHRLRIEKATKLLQDTPYTVEQIALKVGYQSALTLTRAYKRYYDMSPGSARKNTK